MILLQSEFSYNNSINKSKGKSPFYIVYGFIQRGVNVLRDTSDLGRKSVEDEDYLEYLQ